MCIVANTHTHEYWRLLIWDISRKLINIRDFRISIHKIENASEKNESMENGIQTST